MWMCAPPESVTVGLATSFPGEPVCTYQGEKYEVFLTGTEMTKEPPPHMPSIAGTFGLSSPQAFTLLLFVQIKDV